MTNVKNYIESGVLEMYVLGVTSLRENEEVMQMISLHPVIRCEIEKISTALQDYLNYQSIQPPAAIKENVLDFLRLKNY